MIFPLILNCLFVAVVNTVLLNVNAFVHIYVFFSQVLVIKKGNTQCTIYHVSGDLSELRSNADIL